MGLQISCTQSSQEGILKYCIIATAHENKNNDQPNLETIYKPTKRQLPK